jgi:uncharacterized membrane protein
LLTATFLALGAAVLHAGWNLAVKQSSGDRFLTLWGQFTIAAFLCAPFVVWGVWRGDLPLRAWTFIAISGAVHLPYAIYLARAYDHGEFSLVYPLARGGGAMLAAIGGVLFLSDDLGVVRALGIGIIGLGLFLLAGIRRSPALTSALIVAGTIGVYSVSDAHGIRSSSAIYALATHFGTATTTTAYGIATGRVTKMRQTIVERWKPLTLTAFAVVVTYGLVQLAFRYAPVGYVSGLRESSVLLAAVVGWRKLGDTGGRRRVIAAVTIVVGLVVLIAGR